MTKSFAYLVWGISTLAFFAAVFWSSVGPAMGMVDAYQALDPAARQLAMNQDQAMLLNFALGTAIVGTLLCTIVRLEEALHRSR